MAKIKPAGYRLEYRSNDPLFLTPDGYKRECRSGPAAGADVWPLFLEPQRGCSADIEVYIGRHWLQPRYAYGRDLTNFVPLYRGEQIQVGQIDESVSLLFPAFIEARLKRERPDLFVDQN